MQNRSPLSGLLRYRAALERAAWMELQRSNAAVAAATDSLLQFQLEKTELARRRLASLSNGISSAELQVIDPRAMDRSISQAAATATQTKAKAELAQKQYLTYRQDREIVENAIARIDALHAQDNERRDQARVDDDTLRRFSRGRRC